MEGSYKDGKKVGQWVLIFNNQEKGGGCYNDEGLKNGCWTELHEKYNEQCQISIKGQYINGIKSNSWIITYQDKHLGGGDYEESQKTGHWIEVYENFNDRCQIILEGEYIKGQKSGQWITKLRESSVEQFQLIIGQGNYKDGLKIGEWIDIDLNYELTNQITYCGEYQNGRKLGFWQIKQNQVVIGGGVYLLGAIKDGQWVELDDNFSDLCQIFYSGQYKNGIKNGDWEIKMRSKNNLNDIIFQGGGKYLQGVQIGIWRELSQNSWNDCQIIYEGSYENGKKYGKWDTYVQQDSSIQKKTLEGGGQYNIKGLKDGPWIDLSESIWNPQQSLIVQKFQSGLSLKNSS
ncbi:unnamed protein product [Paramecium sonneborni]|uniref:Uncharacterized protein n=1 Tax=Paramecium sonneborni TaxID=65129 RepID=A0A8S1R8N2_9CILI|nr:unnamed protein product [Paramecium sonneborni]